MGFFKSFGVDFGKAPGEAPGNERYIPMTLLDVAEIRQDSRERFEIVQVYLQSLAKRITDALVQDTKADIREALAFALAEMFRNVVEHSEATQMGYCAQYWPSKGLVEVGILDSGIGIRRDLAKNPHWSLQNDSHALHIALLPGISGCRATREIDPLAT